MKSFTEDIVSTSLIIASLILTLFSLYQYDLSVFFVCDKAVTNICSYQDGFTGIATLIAGLAVLVVYSMQKYDVSKRIRGLVITSVTAYHQNLVLMSEYVSKTTDENLIRAYVPLIHRHVPVILNDINYMVQLSERDIVLCGYLKALIDDYLNHYSESYIREAWFKLPSIGINNIKSSFIERTNDVIMHLDAIILKFSDSDDVQDCSLPGL